MQAHLRKMRETPADGPGEADGRGRSLRVRPTFMDEANAPEAAPRGG